MKLFCCQNCSPTISVYFWCFCSTFCFLTAAIFTSSVSSSSNFVGWNSWGVSATKTLKSACLPWRCICFDWFRANWFGGRIPLHMLSDKSFLESVIFPLLNQRVNFLMIASLSVLSDFGLFLHLVLNQGFFLMSTDLYVVRILSNTNNVQTVNLGAIFKKANSALLWLPWMQYLSLVWSM